MLAIPARQECACYGGGPPAFVSVTVNVLVECVPPFLFLVERTRPGMECSHRWLEGVVKKSACVVCSSRELPFPIDNISTGLFCKVGIGYVPS